MKSGGEVHYSWRRLADYLRPLHHPFDVSLAHTTGQEGQRMEPWRMRNVIIVNTLQS